MQAERPDSRTKTALCHVVQGKTTEVQFYLLVHKCYGLMYLGVFA